MVYHSNNLQKDISRIIHNYPHWKELKNKTILITQLSKTMFLFLDVLMDKKVNTRYNISVIVLEENLNKFKYSSLAYSKNPNFHVYPEELCYLMINSEKIDYIIHQEKSISSMNDSIVNTNQILLWTHLCQATKLIYLSSTNIYGKINDILGTPVKEQRFEYLNCDTIDDLDIEKIRITETLCQAYISQYNINIAIIRLAPLLSTVQLPLSIVQSSKKERKQATSAHFCYIADAVSSILHLLTNGEQGQAYNVASPSLKSFFNGQRKLVNIDTTKMKELGWVGLYMINING